MPLCDHLATRAPGAPVVPPPAVASLVATGAYTIDRALDLPRILPGWTRALGLGAIVGGIGLAFSALLRFKQEDVTHSPFSRPTGFVTEGPYRFTRNPMYTGLALSLLGIGLVRGTVLGILSPLLLAGILTRWQIRFEESALEDQFGDDYVEYKKRVRRWI